MNFYWIITEIYCDLNYRNLFKNKINNGKFLNIIDSIKIIYKMNTLIRKTKIFTRILNSNLIFRNSSLRFSNKPYQLCVTPLLNGHKFNFCDKPPKGFENFDRKRKTPIPKEEKTEKPVEKEEKSFEEKTDEDKKETNKQRGRLRQQREEIQP